MINDINLDWIEGKYIYESPDGGATIRKRPAANHPIEILGKGEIPIDIWFKIYGKKHGT
jgi:hypothetical protein